MAFAGMHQDEKQTVSWCDINAKEAIDLKFEKNGESYNFNGSYSTGKVIYNRAVRIQCGAATKIVAE